MRFFKNLFFGFAFLFLLSGRVFAINYPDAYGHVNDFADIFSSGFKINLEQQLVQFNTDTKNEIAVVTVNNLEGTTVEEYAVKLFEKWGIGKKAEDNGLLLLIAPNEKQVRIEVGYGLEPVITDGRAGEIIRNQITPEFKNGNYEAGVQAAVDKIESYLTNPNEIFKPQVATKSVLPNFGLSILTAIVIMIYFISYLGRSKEFITGGAVGAVMGFLAAGFFGGVSLGLFGLILDYILSKNYKKLKSAGKSTGFWSSGGGFKSGGGGGFGGGSSGGGGASGSW